LAISPTILLLYWIHIFQILVRSRQQLKLLAYGLQLKSYVSILCSWIQCFQTFLESAKFIGRSFMSRYLNPLYDQFAAELNPQLKPWEADIKIRPKLIYGAI
jgi:hypothetical protein